MPAPKGNRFWELRATHGRAKLFASPEAMWKAACEYFEWCENNPLIEEDFISSGPKAGQKVKLNKMRPFTMQGLCLYLDCNTMYFNQFEQSLKEKEDQGTAEEKQTVKDFSLVVTRIREAIYNQKFTGAAAGFLNANIIARDLGLSDKKELEGNLSITQITGMEIK